MSVYKHFGTFISPKQKEYLTAIVQWKKVYSVAKLTDDERYYLFRVMNCTATAQSINKFMKEKGKELNERV